MSWFNSFSCWVGLGLGYNMFVVKRNEVTMNKNIETNDITFRLWNEYVSIYSEGVYA